MARDAVYSSRRPKPSTDYSVGNPLWHPFANMHEVNASRLTIVRGRDVWLWDDAGHKYFDATSSLWYANVGHGRTEIIDAIADQLRTLEAYQCFGDFANRPALALAEELSGRSPMTGAKVFFTSGGGDSIDTAAKLARAYFTAICQPDRSVLIHRTHSYHGTHGFGTALAGMAANRVGGPWVKDTVEVPAFDSTALEATIKHIGPERCAAFFCEPVIGAGGVLAPPQGYLAEVETICRRYGLLFIADSVICGFGRLGTWFGVERFNVVPDIIVFAKGVTSGYQPLGGLIVASHVAGPFWDAPGHVFRHGQTYAGHPAACAAALANIAVLESDGLLPRAVELETLLLRMVASLSDHPLVRDYRGGVGFLAALELEPDLLERHADLAVRVTRAVRTRGALIRPMGTALGFAPPLTTTVEHLDRLAESVRCGLNDVLAEVV